MLRESSMDWQWLEMAEAMILDDKYFKVGTKIKLNLGKDDNVEP